MRDGQPSQLPVGLGFCLFPGFTSVKPMSNLSGLGSKKGQ